jgi:DNA modification methylase
MAKEKASKINGIPVYCSYDRPVDLVDLVEHPSNPNKHGDKQIALLSKIIRNQGWRNPVIVSKRSGFIVAGHGRLAAAKLLNVEAVPVDYQDFANEAEEHAHLIADNRIAELAEIDSNELAGLLRDLEGKIDLDLTGFDKVSLDDILTATEPESAEVDAEPQIDKAEELQAKWKTELGQVWELGDHRLICGDSTDEDTIKKLMNGKVAGLMVTDPPYGVEYDANWRNNAKRADGTPIGASAIGKVENDSQADWSDAWKLFAGDIAYVWHGGAKAPIVADSLIRNGFELVSQIIWAKNVFAIGRGDYHWKHEPCWYVVRKGAKRNFTDDRTQCTLWEIDKPVKSETGHSTQKPIECMARPIRNHKFDTVYDPFLGSGTTLIACENLKRKCYGVELNPGYVAVILQRWADATGREPKLCS